MVAPPRLVSAKVWRVLSVARLPPRKPFLEARLVNEPRGGELHTPPCPGNPGITSVSTPADERCSSTSEKGALTQHRIGEERASGESIRVRRVAAPGSSIHTPAGDGSPKPVARTLEPHTTMPLARRNPSTAARTSPAGTRASGSQPKWRANSR